MDQRYYQPLLDEIRAHALPLRGLNLPRSLIKKVTAQGLDALTKQERAALPAVGPIDPYQRQLLSAVFAGHSKGSRSVDRFVDVQNLWDESMAAQAAAFLQSPAGKDKQLIIVAGGYHVARGLGVPRKLFNRLPLSYLICEPELVDPEAMPEDAKMEVETPVVPLPAADVYWYTRYERLPTRPLLGVIVRNGEQGVRVESVAVGGAAATAGIQVDDVIVAVDRKTVLTPAELSSAISGHAAGDKLRIEIRRGAKRVEVIAELRTD